MERLVPGFAIWAEISATVLARVLARLTEHKRWVPSGRLPRVAGSSHIDMVETVRGGKVLVTRNARPATPDLTDQTIAPLQAFRLHL